MDISATVRLDSRESTVKQVSIPSKVEFSINLTNHIFIFFGMELARAKGSLVTRIGHIRQTRVSELGWAFVHYARIFSSILVKQKQ